MTPITHFPPVVLRPAAARPGREAPAPEPPVEVPPTGRRPLWNLVVQDAAGYVQPGARVAVMHTGTSTFAQLWALDDVTPVTNPATADGEGRVTIRLDAGLYDVGLTTAAAGTRWLREVLATTVATQVVAAKGDLIIGSETGAPARRVAGPDGALLVMVGGWPTWGILPTEATVLGSDGAYPAWVPRGTAPEGSVLVLTAGMPTWRAAGVSLAATGGRLTLDPFSSVSTANMEGQAIYLVPHRGASMPLYDGTSWLETPLPSGLTEISLANLAVGVYDLFAYRGAGTVVVEAPVPWPDPFYRDPNLDDQDGIWVKNGDPTRRYIGTVGLTSLGRTEDSDVRRLVWNAQNRVPRPLRRFEAATGWSYTVPDTWRQANANVANQVEVVVGLTEEPIRLALTVTGRHSAVGGMIAAAIGEDSTTAPMLRSPIASPGDARTTIHLAVDALPNGIGQHTYVWLEAMSLAGTASFYSDPAALSRSGLVGEVWA
jgi:hypothetical protein